MKRNKDIPEREKARSHGYCCPHRQWGIVNSQTKISLPVTATILRYVVSIWDYKDSNHFITVTGDETGYIQIIDANGITTGTAFYIAATK